MSEYSSGWSSFRAKLAMATTLEAWLNIPHFDDCEGWFNVAGELAFQRFNPGEFYRETLVSTIIAQFPHIRSVTEYGCGVGRNLLYLKRRFPDIRCFGYELVPEGVEIAQAAASKFCVDVEYAQLDYVRDPVAKYIFESTDVAFTMFSLEQLPSGCDIALRNILSHVKYGTIHLEPVTEHYPSNVRGLIGKLDHWKAGYLRGFPTAVAEQDLSSTWRESMECSHNALMFPSVYALKK